MTWYGVVGCGGRGLTLQFFRGLVNHTALSRLQLNIHKVMTRLTLDIIGLSAFGYSFNALEDSHDDTLHQAYGTPPCCSCCPRYRCCFTMRCHVPVCSTPLCHTQCNYFLD